MRGGRKIKRAVAPSALAAAVAIFDGLRIALALLLLVDAVRSFFAPEASILGLLLRWPGGRPLPAPCGLGLAAALGVPSRASSFALCGAAVLALANAAEVLVLRADGLPSAGIPFSVIVFAFLALATARTLYAGPAAGRPWAAAGAAVGLPLLLLAHLSTFGATDYARPADAVVVFGAGVRGGEPSLALDDRLQHGIRLYRQGVAPKLVLSGGPDEVPVMRRVAREAGVPESALVLDPAGVDTRSTLRNLDFRRVVAVSHYYHLARIKLAAARAGVACATAPCRMTRRLSKEPFYVARECVALLAYYLEPN